MYANDLTFFDGYNNRAAVDNIKIIVVIIIAIIIVVVIARPPPILPPLARNAPPPPFIPSRENRPNQTT